MVEAYKRIGFVIVTKKKHYRLEDKELLLQEATDDRWILTFRSGREYFEMIFGIDGNYLEKMIWKEDR